MTRLMHGLSPVLVSAAALAALAGAVFASPAGAQAGDGLAVVVEPTSLDVVLGENFDIQVTVTNGTGDATPPLVVHIDITDLRSESSVDPEDWTSTLSQQVGSVPAGGSTTVDWNLQPISAGTYSVYSVLLSVDLDTTVSSNVLTVSVDDQRSLNPDGILPVAIGAPTLVGGLLLLQVRMSSRLDRRDDGDLGVGAPGIGHEAATDRG